MSRISRKTLASDLKYFFKTIHLCIYESKENENIGKLLDLERYKPLVDHTRNQLNRAFDDQDLQSVSKEY